MILQRFALATNITLVRHSWLTKVHLQTVAARERLAELGYGKSGD